MPEKEAQLKQRFGDRIPPKDDPGYTLDKPKNMYRISVTGLQISMPRSRNVDDDSSSSRTSEDRMKDQFMGSTQLLRKGKDPIYPQDVQFDSSNTITFLFPGAMRFLWTTKKWSSPRRPGACISSASSL